MNRTKNLERKNINFVYENQLCHHCGVCYGVCPKDNIGYQFSHTGNPIFRVIDEAKCGVCDLCYRACPGHSVDFVSLHRLVFSSDFRFGWLGTFIDCALAHSDDRVLRRDAASGGVVSSVLVAALEAGTIDGAIVVKLADHGDPFRTETYIARTRSEILAASGSKYQTVPMGIRLRDVWQSSREEHYAFVGLPCHVHGLRKAQQLFPKLKRRVGPVISLFCGRGTCPLGTEFVLKRLKLRKEEVIKVSYRDGKWPGRFTATLKSGAVRFLPLDDYVFIMKMFQNIRCVMCADHTGEFADLSVGDAWLPELKGQEGWNVVVARTTIGQKLLQAARNNKNLVAYPVGSSKVIDSQKLMLYDKKIKIFPSMKIARRFGLSHTIPRYTGLKSFKKIGFHDYLRAVIFMLVPRMSTSKTLTHLVILAFRLPMKFLLMDFKGKRRGVEKAVMKSPQ